MITSAPQKDSIYNHMVESTHGGVVTLEDDEDGAINYGPSYNATFQHPQLKNDPHFKQVFRGIKANGYKNSHQPHHQRLTQVSSMFSSVMSTTK